LGVSLRGFKFFPESSLQELKVLPELGRVVQISSCTRFFTAMVLMFFFFLRSFRWLFL